MYRTRPILDEVKTETTNGSVSLCLKPVDSLPFVSVVTITRNRSHMFFLPLYNWRNFRYPKELIEWVIIDDSDNKNDLKKIIEEEKDPRIKLFYVDHVLPIADKRNYSVKRCQGEYIIHMDDDDYYFSDSVLAKVRILNEYPDKDIVCSIPEGIHDLITEKSAILDSAGDDIPENTLAYRKRYWVKNPFGNSKKKVGHSEWFKFVNNNWHKIINLPFWFNLIALTHNKNVTGDSRRIDISGIQPPNFRKVWNKEERKIIDKLIVLCNKK